MLSLFYLACSSTGTEKYSESDTDTTSQDSETDDTGNSEPIDGTEDVVEAEDTSTIFGKLQYPTDFPSIVVL